MKKDQNARVKRPSLPTLPSLPIIPDHLGSGILTLTVATLTSLCVSLPSFASPLSGQGEQFTLKILHTNDVHAHHESSMVDGLEKGGLARIGHEIRSRRKADPNHTVVIDAGDMFLGTPLFARYRGEVEVSMLNKIGYDVCTLGNHEFEDGPQALAARLGKAKYDVVSCNIDMSDEPELARVVKPHVIKTVAGQKVAFIGALVPELAELPKTGKLKIKGTPRDWVQPIESEVDRLKSEGIDKIVLVTHVGVELDQELARRLPAVDAIIGGHTHTRLEDPIVVKHDDGTSTTIVQTGCYGAALGELDLTFDSAGRVIDSDTRYQLVDITAYISPDSDLQAYLDEMSAPLKRQEHEIIAYSQGRFDNDFSKYPWDSPEGNIIADALYEAGSGYGAQIGFQNRGGIRAPLYDGRVTREKVDEILPFSNDLTFVTVSGQCLIKVLEHSVSGHLGRRFLDQHGLKFAYDRTRPAGHRIVFAMTQESDGRWVPVRPDGRYKVAFNSFSVKGGEGYDFSSATDVQVKTGSVATALADYLGRHKCVAPQSPSRIVPITEGILKVEGDGQKKKISVHGVPANSKITLLVGSAMGVETMRQSLPVPLANHKVVSAVNFKPGANGEFVCDLDINRLPAVGQAGSASGKQSALWLCAVVEPVDGQASHLASADEPIMISYPTELRGNFELSTSIAEQVK